MRILLIEDNPGDARLVQELLQETRGHFTFSFAEKFEQGLKLLHAQNVDVVLLDLNLPDSRGMATLTDLQTRFPRVPFVIMTSIDDEELARQAVRLGAQDYLVKGHATGELLRRTLLYAVERKQAEEALRESEERLWALTDGTSAVIFIKDLEGRYTLVNRLFEDLFHTTKERVIGKTDYAFFPKEEADAFRRNDRRVFETGAPLTTEEFVPQDDGIHTYISVKVPLRDAAGRIYAIGAVATDITERKRAEEALRKAHDELELRVQERTKELNELNETLERRVAERTAELTAANEMLRNSRRASLNLVEDAVAARRQAEKANTELRREVVERKRAEEELKESEGRVRRKLDSILSPEGGIGELELSDIIDIPALQSIVDNLYKFVRLPIGIIDLKGKVLVGVGWQDACTKFHRVHPDSCRHCIESDLELTTGVAAGEFKLYKCKNGMWDAVTPLMVGGQHMGNIFWGQFFFDDEIIDREFFRAQARKYGFDEEEFLAALERVPRISREALDTGMAFYLKLADMLSKLSYSNIKLARSLAERDALTDSLRASEEQFRRAIEDAPIPVIMHAEDGQVLQISRSWTELTGYKLSDLPTLDTWLNRAYGAGADDVRDHVRGLFTGDRGTISLEFPIRTIDGRSRHWSFSASSPGALRDGRRFVVGMAVDITERKRAEESLLRSSRRLEILSEAAGRLLASEKPQEIVNDLCSKVMSYLDCHAFFNYLVDEKKGRLHLNACAGIPEKTVREIEWLDYGVAVCGCAARDRERIVCENIPETPDPRTELVKSFGIKAYACHPLLSGKKVIGTLSFGTRSRLSFSDEDLSLMKIVADQVALAMERMGTKEELATRVRERTAELDKAVSTLQTEVSERLRVEQALVEQSRMLEAFFKHSTTPLVFLDKEFDFIRVNDAYAKACAREVSDFQGHNHFVDYPSDELKGKFARVVETKEPFSVFARPFTFPDHPEWGVTYWDLFLYPILDSSREVDFLVFALHDVTERKRAEEKVLRLNRLYSVLSKISEAIVRIRDRQALFDEVCRIVAEEGRFRLAWVGLFDPESNEVRPVASFGESAYLNGIRIVAADVPEGKGPTGRAVYEDHFVINTDFEEEPLMAPWREKARTHGLRSSAAFPLHAGGKVIGALTIYSDSPSFFTEEEISLLLSLSEDISFALDSMEIEKKRSAAEEALRVLNEELDLRVQTRTTELQEVNKELEAFIYSVSHDLRAPLRTMAGFSRILVEDYRDRLDNQCKDYLGRITNASDKMTRLIEDLLRLSRISRQEIDRIDYDLSAIASAVIQELRDADPARNVKVVVAEGLRTVVDPNLIRIALSNLIENAWKFTSKKEQATIEFGAAEENGQTVYFVKDNGTGFDPHYADRMFWPFHRLHSEKEFEGTGVGLAIVERIIRRHGGRIWAEGEVGKGATVFFTLG